jgi:hypothetical protein
MITTKKSASKKNICLNFKSQRNKMIDMCFDKSTAMYHYFDEITYLNQKN